MDKRSGGFACLYGKDISAKEIVTSGEPIVPAAKPLINLLYKTSPVRKSAA
jgi:hypothetical protein